MHLTHFSDYSLRVLIHLGLNAGRQTSIHEIAVAYDISEAHLMKVVHGLAKHGYVASTRGRGGGLKLARPPEQIPIGAVLRDTEDDMALTECFSSGNTCPIAGPCGLQSILREALDAFLAVLDRHTLDDLLWPHGMALAARLGIDLQPRA
ncbi:MAG TPA: Rrf2 family transcriptional regulator [Magnetospirillaceae bacterium]|jgi:Rrf2 family nitric oxide-sensitive transcriptional repressor